MGDISDFLFGGVDDSAQKGQGRQNQRSGQFAIDQGEAARNDILSLFAPSQQILQDGAQASVDFTQQATPRRINVMQQGSSRGRQAQLAGLDQIQNAILGLPVDMQSLQQFGSPIDVPEAAPAQLPNMVSIKDLPLPQGQTTDPFMNNQERNDANSDGITNKTDFDVAGVDWGEYIGRPGNEDLATEFNSQSWTNDPQEWAQRLWIGNAADVADPRFYRDFGTGVNS